MWLVTMCNSKTSIKIKVIRVVATLDEETKAKRDVRDIREMSFVNRDGTWT